MDYAWHEIAKGVRVIILPPSIDEVLENNFNYPDYIKKYLIERQKIDDEYLTKLYYREISEDEIMRTVAVFRFILPDKFLRFAGGRARLSDAAERRILTGGMNGVIMGDMLTTIGNRIDEDRELFRSLGLEPA